MYFVQCTCIFLNTGFLGVGVGAHVCICLYVGLCLCAYVYVPLLLSSSATNLLQPVISCCKIFYSSFLIFLYIGFNLLFLHYSLSILLPLSTATSASLSLSSYVYFFFGGFSNPFYPRPKDTKDYKKLRQFLCLKKHEEHRPLLGNWSLVRNGLIMLAPQP